MPLRVMKKPITIVGGGLAGLTLGIGLRQRDMPVTIFEAGHYPRHRVCGEFISGRGQEILTRLGLRDTFVNAGGRMARDVAFYNNGNEMTRRTLPSPALCLSRFKMDALLAETFQRLGGELFTGKRWTDSQAAAGVVRASGRRIEPVVEGWRLFGLKVHARNVELESDLEMHFRKEGYVGLCRLGEGLVNVCGLFRSRSTVPNLGQSWRDWLCGPPGSQLQARLNRAQFDEQSFCSVAGISLRPVPAIDLAECAIGDAFTMIPPVTGNGMSLAFESAELSVEPLIRFATGEAHWEETRRIIAAECDTRFARRLRNADWMQRAIMHPGARKVLFSVTSLCTPVWSYLFARTR